MSGIVPASDGAEACFHAPSAELIEVCVFSDGEEQRHALVRDQEGTHRGRIPGMRPGSRYGLRTHGPWSPEEGLWHHPDLLLVDPFTRAVSGQFADDPSVHHDGPRRDSASRVPRSVLTEPPPPPRPGPSIPWSDTVIYETHVRSLTMGHPDVPSEHRGTYLGVASPPVVDHLQRLGVTAVELMPVAHHVTEPFLQERGLRNYWGYSTLAWFAPHAGYATGDDGRQVAEFAEMVDRLHAAGLEVILDVVFNHTAEGGLSGPILSLKGLDNRGWYRLGVEGEYVDWTGTGNTVDTSRPHVRQAIRDCLRWWAVDMRVDGFRFDLAVTLGRDTERFDASHLAWISEDPVLSRRKLIAEPWDLGPGGYRLGGFGRPWREWNGRFRDDIRDFWRGKGNAPHFALRVGGSPDVFEERAPQASIDFVTAHDGFTLADLVAYDRKHNEANQEANHDGHDDNRSWNSGHEGPTDDRAIFEVRRRRARALLATALLSAGTPMILGGDELGVTHDGNNNAYPLDQTNWYDWRHPLHCELVSRLTALRRRMPSLRSGAARLLEEGAVTAVELGDGHSLVVANPSPESEVWTLPPGAWELVFDSSGLAAPPDRDLEIPAWSVTVLLSEAGQSNR